MERSKEEIRREILDNLAVSLGVNITEEGSIAIAIVDAVLDEIYNLYLQLDYAKRQAYLSTASGNSLDKIAELVGTERDENEFETDDDLKLKASTSVFRNAKGNRLAIEEAAMRVSGVASIDYRPFGSGTGSFVIYIYPQPEYNQTRLLENVEAALEDVVADGIYFQVKQPEEVPVDVHLMLQFDEEVGTMERQVIRNNVHGRIRQYLNNLRRNEVLYINEIIHESMSASNHILDVSVLNLFINGIEKTISNTFPTNDERFISGDIKII